MAIRSCRGQVILEVVLAISFFIMLAYLGHQQNEKTYQSLQNGRFGKKWEGKYYDTQNR